MTSPLNVVTPVTFKVDVLTSDVLAIPVKAEPSPWKVAAVTAVETLIPLANVGAL